MGTAGELNEALQGLDRMYKRGKPISQDLVLPLVEKCIKEKNLVAGKHVHQLMVGNGLDSAAILVEHLIQLFTLSDSLLEANLIFCKVAKPSVFTWRAVILAHVTHRKNGRALDLYTRMQQDGMEPNKFIYMCVLKACSSIGDLDRGRWLNYQIVRSGLELDEVVGNTLIDMYAKCGSLCEACKIFDGLSNRDVVSWGAMLGGYAQHGKGVLALELFEKMQHGGTKPNKVILLCMLRACGGLEAIHQGKLIHDRVIRNGLGSDAIIGGALIDMYAKCGNLPEAQKVLDTSASKGVVSWCALIGGYTQQGQNLSAFGLFERMQQEGVKANEFIFSCLLSACGSIGDLDRGKFIHDQVIKTGVESDDVLGNTLVGMYAHCGQLEMAQKVFDKLSARTVVSWSTMISGYVQHGYAFNALELFKKMQEEDTKTNMIIFSSILKACASVGAIEQGKLVHHQMLRSECELDVVVGSTLIEMYAACGCLEEAHKVFNMLPIRNAVCWGVMIAGFAEHGNCRLAGHFLHKMLKQGLKPNAKIFTSLLVACKQTGKFEEGQQYFKSMTEDHGITPSVEHVHCMVDLLGRAGHLMKAERLLQSMPVTNDVSGWMSLLSACRIHGNVGLGRQCFDQIVNQDANIGAVYTLMSCIYADAQMWDDYHQILELKNGTGPEKSLRRHELKGSLMEEMDLRHKGHCASPVQALSGWLDPLGQGRGGSCREEVF